MFTLLYRRPRSSSRVPAAFICAPAATQPTAPLNIGTYSSNGTTCRAAIGLLSAMPFLQRLSRPPLLCLDILARVDIQVFIGWG